MYTQSHVCPLFNQKDLVSDDSVQSNDLAEALGDFQAEVNCEN